MLITPPHQSSPSATPHTLADDSRATLLALLDEGLTLSPESRPQLSSHLPMALDALQQLGADSARLHEFQQRYSPRLQAEPMLPAGAARPRGFGRIEDYAPWFSYFRAALAARGRDAMLLAELPALMLGAGGAAFHGLIRVGHALRHGHAGELAAALAYWACRHQPLPEPSDTRPLGLPDWLAALRALPGAAHMPKRRLISERMADWGQRTDWQAIAGRLPSDELPALARAAAALYAGTGNFTVLHMITASAALLALLPWLQGDEAARRHFIRAAAAALMASGAVQQSAALTLAEPAQAPGWAALAAAAIAQHDDHVIKLVAACQALDAADSAPVWRAAAARALQRDASAA